MTEHLTDGQLVQLLDGLSDGNLPAQQHVDHCVECRTRVAAWRRRSKRFTALLQETDEAVPAFEPPSPRRVDRRVVLAASVVLLLVGAFAVQPVRAWIIAQGRAALQLVSRDEPNGTSSTIVDSVVHNTVDLSFTPQRSALFINVAGLQMRGSIRVRRGDGPDVTATVIDASEEDGIVILPNGFFIENSPASVATYEVTIPLTIESVDVVVAGDRAFDFTVGPGFRERIVNIGPGPGS